MRKIPKVALGTWSWGAGIAGGDTVFGNHLTEAQLSEIFSAGMWEGLNMWDTAAVYGMGSSESALGKLIPSFPRNDIILSTKFTPQIADDALDEPVTAMLETSLERLGVKYIDLYWIHNPLDVDKWTPGLIPLLQDGRIKRVGVSNHNLSQIRRANAILGEAGFAVNAVQNHYSLLYRSSEYAGILDYCRNNNMTFFAYMVLEQGALSGRYNTTRPMPVGSDRAVKYNPVLPQLEELTKAMAEMGKKKNASVAQVAIAWAISKGAVPLIGATKVQHVLDAAKASTIVLDNDEIKRLESLADDADVDTRGSWEASMELIS